VNAERGKNDENTTKQLAAKQTKQGQHDKKKKEHHTTATSAKLLP